MKKRIKGLIWRFKNTSFVAHISFLWHWKNFFFLLKYPFYREYNRWHGKFCGYAFTEYDAIPNGWRKAFGKQLSKDIKKAGKESRKRVGKRLSWKKMICWQQIKEKYGSLRLYASATQEIQDVLGKYELMSEGYCINCGKPARYKTCGWVEYYCEDCMIKDLKSGDKYRKEPISDKEIQEKLNDYRLAVEDIPQLTTYDYVVHNTEVYDTEEEWNKRYEELLDAENRPSNMCYRKTINPENLKWQIEFEERFEEQVNLKEKYGIDFESLWDLK